MSPPGAPATTIGAVQSGGGIDISSDGTIEVSEIINSMVSPTAGIDSTKISYLASTATGAVTRNLNARLRDTISITDFGAVGDGITNDFTAFKNAIAAATGKALYIPTGTYLIILPDATGLGILENINICGNGLNSFLDIRTSTSSILTVFFLRSNTVIENLKIKLTLLSAQLAFLFTVQTGVTTSGVAFKSCELFTNYVEGSFIQDSYLLNINNNAVAVTDLLIDGCIIHNWLYTVLKTNSATSNDLRWTVVNSRFYDNATAHLSINSPRGSHEGLIISNNIFNDVTDSSPGTQHCVGIASVQNCVISSNLFQGLTSGESIHIEENSDYVTVQGNVIEVGDLNGGTTWGDGIRILSNDIAGTRRVPSNISIVGNTILRTGTTGGNGIAFTWDTNGTSAEFVTCANNVVDGFGVGILVGADVNTVRINGNVIRNCLEGMLMPGSGDPQIAGNSLISCATGILGRGLIGSHHFIDCPAEVESYLATGLLSTTGWSIEQSGLVLANGNTVIPIMLVGARLQGQLSVNINAFNTTATFLLDINYDGTNLNTTPGFLYQPGTVQFVSMSVSGGQLQLTVSCVGGTTNAVLRADFDGLYVCA